MNKISNLRLIVIVPILLLTITRILAEDNLPSPKSNFIAPKIDLLFSVFSVTEDASISKGAATSIEGHFGYLLDENISLTLWPVTSFISGQQTSRDPQSPLTNSIYLNEASVEMKLAYNVKIKLGTLYQKDYLPGMAGQSKSFPAIALIAPINFETISQFIELRTQAAVPTSSGIANSTTELQSSSSLLSAGIWLKSNWNNNFSTHLSLTKFKFNHLSSQIATDSLQRGNTVIKLNASSGSFIYNYSGNEIIFSLNYLFNNDFNLNFKTSYIKNNSAPRDLNQGYYFAIKPGFKISAKYTLRPVLEKYHVQSDAMVAVFSDTRYGRTNRDGHRLGLNLETNKYLLELLVAQSNLIQPTPFQSADRSIFINLEIDNIPL
ncbi:MAG: hypothetical protein Q7U04_17845 [Bacteriovorax sp.]|nr:hypothetical protein [Bacteriovorax sp.]